MEHLVTALCRVISQVPEDPMKPEMIGIQSRGMKQWLTTAIAEAFGICANVEFLFPREIIERVTGVEKTRGEELPVLNRDMMTWAVMDMLGEKSFGAGLGALPSAYVNADKNGRKTLQLSRKIAACFDDCQVYRPDLLAAWSKNNDTLGGLPNGPGDIHASWQAELWRKLIRLGTPLPQRVAPLTVAGTGTMPERISLFGVSAMPPGFLEAFDILGRTVDVYFFLLTPSNQFFFDQRSKRQVDRMALEEDNGAGEHLDMTPGLFDDLFAGQGGNPLLAALGRTGREFHGILENFDYHEPFGELFEDPVPQLITRPETGDSQTLSMLAVIQSDILNLVHRGKDLDAQTLPVAEGDRSVAVHACHSPMREAQVLKDLLLDAFRKDPDLAPHDIIVMMPDIEAYAPYLEAVFSQAPRIPYTVSDRRKRSESRTLDAFLKILALTDTRLEAAPVMAVLLAPAVAEKFGLGLTDRDRVAEAFTAAGVIWGEDGAHRERLMGKGVEENTWQFGMRRLMAGIAMPDGEDDLISTVLPGDGFEGLDADILGRAAHFLNTLFSCLDSLARERTPGDWGDTLKFLVRSLLETDHSNEGDIGFLLNAIDEMAAQAAEGGYDSAVGFPVIRDIIEHKLDQNISQGSFLAGSL
ncbi:MAG: exodeoxyribonuclease V subunit gamma, partial [Desulfobacterales bacterium]|nr:exodeoxyribonuclease V subunit gamma [Desulfobacterales bacterium]